MKFTPPIPSRSNENFCFQVGDYSFGFQAQEQDKEMWDGSVTYKYRVEDPRLGRFFSVDPLYAKYPWNSNYAFSENRVIDGIELEGLEYTPVNNWDTNVDQATLKKNLGSDYTVGMEMTYSEYFEKRSTQIAEYYKGHKLDCADLNLKIVCHFAVENRLPLEFKSYRADVQDSHKETNGVVRPDYSIDGQFSQQQVDDVFAKFQALNASEFEKNDIMFKSVQGVDSSKPGDIIVSNYGKGHYHAQFIEFMYFGKTGDGFVSVIQGNTDSDNNAAPVEQEQYSLRAMREGKFANNTGGGNYQIRKVQPGSIQFKRWNFQFMIQSFNQLSK